MLLVHVTVALVGVATLNLALPPTLCAVKQNVKTLDLFHFI